MHATTYTGRVLDVASRLEDGIVSQWLTIARQHQVTTYCCAALAEQTLSAGAWITYQVKGDEVIGWQLLAPAPEANWQPKADVLRWHEAKQGRFTRMEVLLLRHAFLQQLRQLLATEDFVEIETPLLIQAPSPEVTYEPFVVYPSHLNHNMATHAAQAVANENPNGGPTSTQQAVDSAVGFLIPSPELQLKRLLVGGFERIYRLGAVFRANEVGQYHNPEFTMLEWYRPFSPFSALVNDLERWIVNLSDCLFEEIANKKATEAIALFTDLNALLQKRPWPVITVSALLQNMINVKGDRWLEDTSVLCAAATQAGIKDVPAAKEGFVTVFSAVWNHVEDQLPSGPLFITEWPASLTSLAATHPQHPLLAERVELYINGVEIANGYSELTDVVEQQKRFEKNVVDRSKIGLPKLPIDESFLDALRQGMPPAVGCALGIDRLLMTLLGCTHIKEVLPFQWNER